MSNQSAIFKAIAIMTNTILDEPKVRAWIKQFGDADQANAATLVSLVKLIPGDRFRRSLTQLLDERLKAGALPVALYNEFLETP